MEQNINLDQEPVIIQQGGGAVNSVNGQTGDVVLTTSDIENTSDYQTGTEVQSAIDTTIGQIDIPTKVSELQNDSGFQTAQQVANAVAGEASLREAADTNLQGQIDAITASSDVTDIVGTYAALQAYDTSTLGNNDIIKVLQDESQNDETTYYRWSTTTQTFTLIGEEGPYYTKSAADQKFQDKLTAGTNITIDANNEISATDTTYSAGTNITITGTTISATDTTYSDFTGTDGQTAGTAGLVPAPATTDADKFLKSDGTWDTAGGGSSVTVVQTTGTSTTDVMSQKATTRMVHGDNTWASVKIQPEAGKNFSANRTSIIVLPGNGYYGSTSSIILGGSATFNNVVAIGIGSTSQYQSVAIGEAANANADNAVAIGYNAKATRKGEVNVGAGTSTSGYNSTSYRVLGGVHPAVDTHDATTLGQLNARIVGSGTAAPTTSTVGSVGSLYAYVESGTGHLAICTDDTGGTYTWQTLV